MKQNNSSHYQDGVETVVHQETVCNLLEGAGIPARTIHFVATALKYAERAGKKQGESFEKDTYKEADYLCRALTGKWLHECNNEDEYEDLFFYDGLGQRIAHTRTKAGEQFNITNDMLDSVMGVKIDDTIKGDSDLGLALRVLSGEFGDGAERMEKLGSRYDNVQKIVNVFCEAKKPWYKKEV